MLKLSSKITINETLVFDFVNEIEIDSSYENLTDTCKIIIPKKINLNDKPLAIGANAVFKRGMKIKVEIGYDDTLKTAFTGYITKVNLTIPITLECEDSMYLLKKNTLANKSYSSVSLSTLLKYIIPASISYDLKGFEYENLGQIRISNSATSAQVLDMLRKNYNIYSWFRDDVLYIGVAYLVALQKKRTFGFEKNIIDDKSLEWRDSDDVKIKVKGVSVQKDNTKVEYTHPTTDAEGELSKLSVPGLSLSDLKKQVIRFYDSFQYTGYRGDFTTFGEPFVNHGDLINFTGEKLEERNEGNYLVRSVKRSFGQSGYRQSIELGQQIK